MYIFGPGSAPEVAPGPPPPYGLRGGLRAKRREQAAFSGGTQHEPSYRRHGMWLHARRVFDVDAQLGLLQGGAADRDAADRIRAARRRCAHHAGPGVPDPLRIDRARRRGTLRHICPQRLPAADDPGAGRGPRRRHLWRAGWPRPIAAQSGLCGTPANCAAAPRQEEAGSGSEKAVARASRGSSHGSGSPACAIASDRASSDSALSGRLSLAAAARAIGDFRARSDAAGAARLSGPFTLSPISGRVPISSYGDDIPGMSRWNDARR